MRKGFIGLEWIIVLCVVAIIGLCVWAYIDRNQLTEGTVVGKKHTASYVWFQSVPSGSSHIMIPHFEPEKWFLVIEGILDGQSRRESHRVSECYHDSAKIGDHWEVAK